MKKLYFILICSILCLCSSCSKEELKYTTNAYYKNYIYDIVKLNDTIFICIPSNINTKDKPIKIININQINEEIGL